MQEMTILEVSERKKRHQECVRRYCRQGKLTWRRSGKYIMVALDEKYWAMRSGEGHDEYLVWLRERAMRSGEAVNIVRAIELLDAVVRYDVESIKELDIRVGLDRLREFIKCQLHVAMGVQSNETGK